MSRYLVEIYVPTISSRFEMYIPEDILVRELVTLIAKGVQKLTNNTYIPSKDVVLCDSKKEQILDINKYVGELNICNGYQLILI